MRRASIALAIFCALTASATADDKSFFRFGDPEPGRKSAKGCMLPMDPKLHLEGLSQKALLQTTYERQVYERIAGGTPCTCQTYFPSFDEALAEFRRQPIDPAQWKEMDRLREANKARIREIAKAVEAACKAAGVL
jgi:hypothetical protein